MASTLRSRFIDAEGIRTHYVEAGDDGPVIVVVHGGGPGASGEAGAGTLALELARDFRVIALDSIGYAQTAADVHLRNVPDGLWARLRHLEAFVDALCLDQFALVGNSHGAWCAAKYATLHPQLVSHLVLVASGTIAESLGVEQNRSGALSALVNYDWTREGMRKILEVLVNNPERITEGLIDHRFENAMRPGVRAAYKEGLEANRRVRTDPRLRYFYDLRSSLPALTKVIPTSLIWGENDLCAPPELGQRVGALLPDAPFNWVPNAGHQVQTDQPGAVAAIIRALMGAAAVAV